MKWSGARASTWLKRYADDVASDAYKMGGDDCLYSAAGAAYYAVIHGVGYNTKEEFVELMLSHIGLDWECVEDAIKEIER
jgi:hypothetical protein